MIKKCLFCQKDFEGRKTKVFCSDRCRGKNYRKNATLNYECSVCGERFETKVSGRKTCSEKCYKTSISRNSLKADLAPLDINELGDKNTMFGKTFPSTRNKLNKGLRNAILKRDGHKCYICESQNNLEVHHFEHKVNGGTDDPKNLITLCMVCHNVFFHNKGKKKRIKTIPF